MYGKSLWCGLCAQIDGPCVTWAILVFHFPYRNMTRRPQSCSFTWGSVITTATRQGDVFCMEFPGARNGDEWGWMVTYPPGTGSRFLEIKDFFTKVSLTSSFFVEQLCKTWAFCAENKKPRPLWREWRNDGRKNRGSNGEFLYCTFHGSRSLLCQKFGELGELLRIDSPQPWESPMVESLLWKEWNVNLSHDRSIGNGISTIIYLYIYTCKNHGNQAASMWVTISVPWVLWIWFQDLQRTVGTFGWLSMVWRMDDGLINKVYICWKNRKQVL